MIEFSKIFNSIVDKITNDVKIDSQVGNQYFTCNTKWARKGKTVTGFDIDGVILTKRITNVIDRELIELEDDLIIMNSLNLNQPFDITGTKIATNLEWSKKDHIAMEKTPLIWLLDSFDEQTFGDESPIERSVDIKVFFLDETDIKNYYTADHKAQVIQPMMNLKDEFIKEIKKTKSFKGFESDRVKYFSRFGTETAQGFEKNILDANLSGLLTSLNITIYKGNCKC